MKATESLFSTLQRMEVKLSKGKYEEEDIGHGNKIPYTIRKVGMYLVVESAIGIAVMWDRKTTVRILLEPQHSVSHCYCFGDEFKANFDGVYLCRLYKALKMELY